MAEWVTLLVSAAIVGGIAIFLVVQTLRERSDLVAVEVHVLADRAEARGATFIVPLEVHNRGVTTLTRVMVGVRREGEPPELERRVEVSYLGEGASRTAYLVLDQDPRAGSPLRARALHYEVE